MVAFTLAALAAWALPEQRNFVPKASIRPSVEVRAMLGHLKNPRLVGLYATAFIAMGVFVSMYNFFGFRAVALGDEADPTGGRRVEREKARREHQ